MKLSAWRDSSRARRGPSSTQVLPGFGFIPCQIWGWGLEGDKSVQGQINESIQGQIINQYRDKSINQSRAICAWPSRTPGCPQTPQNSPWSRGGHSHEWFLPCQDPQATMRPQPLQGDLLGLINSIIKRKAEGSVWAHLGTAGSPALPSVPAHPHITKNRCFLPKPSSPPGQHRCSHSAPRPRPKKPI